MSLSYRPSSNLSVDAPWDTAFLSDRDVSSQVPVNFIPHPGVYVTSACFANGVYDRDEAETCISNLLASAIRRFIFDLYWDPLRRTFSMCPVQISPGSDDTSLSDVATVSRTGAAMANIVQTSSTTHAVIFVRQTSAPSNTSSTSVLGNSTSSFLSSLVTTSVSSAASAAVTTGTSGDPLVQNGGYKCSSNLDINSIASLFNDYIAQTSRVVTARLQYLVFNIHAAAPVSDPTSQGIMLTGDDLPRSDESLRARLNLINQFFYTPPQLDSDRQNLNASWYRRSQVDQLPLSEYFTTNTLSNGVIDTPDGWPSEEYVQLNLGLRVISGIGTIDSQMSQYNTDNDRDLLFPPGSITNDRAATLTDTGSLSSGCYYNANEFQVSQLNNSWAVSSIINIATSGLGDSADNLTVCGISPVLNETLNGVSAGVQGDLYQIFGYQALFSWASGEPTNGSSVNGGADTEHFRCALMVSSDAYTGHWRVEDCRKKYRTACREANQPYLWRVSVDAAPFANAPDACTGNTTFDVPRTGLENTYLYHHIISDSVQQRDDSLLDGIWINFNSLDADSCWVTSGPNGTCPYYQDENALRQRKILVPAIAAFVVLLLTVLTILIKCNTNHRNSKVRKRGEGGWDYEGVPS